MNFFKSLGESFPLVNDLEPNSKKLTALLKRE